MLLHYSKSLHGDKKTGYVKPWIANHDFMASAVVLHGSSLEFASFEMRATAQHVLQAIAQDPQSFRFATDSLRVNQAFAIQLLVLGRNQGLEKK